MSELIGAGRSADVYAHGTGLVLRRYRAPHDTLREAAVMQYVHDRGFPVPTVVESSGSDLVMERVDGPTMLADLSRRPWRLRRHARVLAELHNRLASIPAPDWLEGPFEDRDAVVHQDLHPDNVVLTPQGPVVIDWTGAVAGHPGREVASTWVIMATSVPPGGSRGRAVAAVGRRLFLRTFLAHVEHRPTRAMFAETVRRRLDDRNVLDVERVRLERLGGLAPPVR